ncbi:hypothetical protein FHS18_006732 [Paenibacillus phyllosphaerae]|uniref:Uncharacterized protein n=1 Tax=Paenibacillus phyllosphaerae TaxID=274593 RepID=A0A7W5FRK0_9BACL|nr:hypothetical protein [Paenibacillus phyllosphaerae]MBB3114610.1 hypothetical protein [Paenibacillus phyllosphaerae]
MKVKNEQLEDLIVKLRAREEAAPLSPKQPWREELDTDIAALVLAEPRGTLAIALKCGLHLLNDSIDLAHGYAQQIEHDATGAYWHGIIHHMEHDYSNAKYWLYASGKHAASRQLEEQAFRWLKEESDWTSAAEGKVKDAIEGLAAGSRWNALLFVDAIALQESGVGSEQTYRILQHVQGIEIQALFDYTLAAAVQAGQA